ncbi:MAG: regulatory iron-sulfur-containing complex subunit RicT [Chitinophagaceae bacterium]
MACGNCGTSGSGKPAGCQSNGGCSSGGCNRMNVHDWLRGIPLSDTAKPFSIVEISFSKGSRKDFFRNSSSYFFEKGENVVVEGASGWDLGQVSLQGELVKLQLKKYNVEDNAEIKRILRSASELDLKISQENKGRQQEIMVRSRAMARSMKLDMKISEVEIQADGKKVTFFYTAEHRIDFRELIKVYASDFKMKVEMRQIGARQEAAKIGGIGSCGRELCCSTWLSDFKTVNISAARYQNLSINQAKLSGQCGRLKCCLNYELDTYMDGLKAFPTDADTIETVAGKASLQKRDIFRNLMWYSFHGSSQQYPITIERAIEIRAMNKEGRKPEELGFVEIERHNKPDVEIDKGFVNDVGQITLKSLERNAKNRKKRNKDKTGSKPEAVAKEGNPNPNAQQQKKQGNRPNNPRPQGANPQAKQGQPNENLPHKNPNQQQGNAPNNPNQQQGNPRKNRGPRGDRPQKPNPPKGEEG